MVDESVGSLISMHLCRVFSQSAGPPSMAWLSVGTSGLRCLVGKSVRLSVKLWGFLVSFSPDMGPPIPDIFTYLSVFLFLILIYGPPKK